VVGHLVPRQDVRCGKGDFAGGIVVETLMGTPGVRIAGGETHAKLARLAEHERHGSYLTRFPVLP
jgi:hypothetical protein